jgi:hypothetical protein
MTEPVPVPSESVPPAPGAPRGLIRWVCTKNRQIVCPGTLAGEAAIGGHHEVIVQGTGKAPECLLA